MNTGIFHFGKYQGRAHQEVCVIDPSYIIHVYETIRDNGGISREVYHEAGQVLAQDIEDSEKIEWDEDVDEILEELEYSQEADQEF